ncbi:MAG: DegT/DnrJ/EryC1/StrS family aminotransferase [Chloroflexi bacterium]|nr:DegT/DnrJ/EryC1/StrS family aminotransferase [Chloroflexota bacterium]
MTNKYLLADETIDQKDIEGLIDWLKTNPWLTQGKLVREFEARWAEWIGSKHATFVNSGSSANLLMYYSLLLAGRLKNRKVIVPAVSWATTVAPAIQLGFEPIMCEADWDTFGLDLNHLESLLKEHDPAAVITVHVLGVPNDLEPLLALKDRYGFALMEDSCAATGSRYDGKRVGTFGDLGSYSFYFGHHLSTIEGGMIVTDDDELHEILLHIRSHGWAKDLPKEREETLARTHGIMNFNRPFTFYYPGFNVRSTDLNARLGLLQMEKADRVVARRAENHAIYQARFSDIPGFHCQRNPRGTTSSISFATLAQSPEHRDRIAVALQAAGIETRPLGGGNMSRQPFWSDRHETAVFPVADRIHTTSIQLPNHPLLTPDDVNHICDTVLSVT